MSLHTHDTQIPSKVPAIRSTNRQSVSQSCKGRINSVIISRVDRHHALLNGRVRSRKEVGPNLFHVGSRNATALVRYLDDDIFIVISVGNNYLDGWEITVDTMPVDSRSHAVLEQL